VWAVAALSLSPRTRSNRREPIVARFTRAEPQGAGMAAAADALQDADKEQARRCGTSVEGGAEGCRNAFPHVRVHGEPETGAERSSKGRSREAGSSQTNTSRSKVKGDFHDRSQHDLSGPEVGLSLGRIRIAALPRC